jgi:hypothetical protein
VARRPEELTVKTLPKNRVRFAVLAAALASSLVVALGGCMSAPSSSEPIAAASPPTRGAGFVYSANEGADSISRFDLATGRVLTLPIPVTRQNVQISRDERRLLGMRMSPDDRKIYVAATMGPRPLNRID